MNDDLYKSKYSKGDRRDLIKISSNIILNETTKNELLDGNNHGRMGGSAIPPSIKNGWILFEFKTPINIVELKWYQESGYNLGKWILQGSMNNIRFKSIGSPFDFTSGTFKFKNAQCYKYYKMMQIDGSTSNPFVYEIEFGISNKTNKFMLEQNGKLYTIKSEFYEPSKSQYKPITGININNITDEDLKKYGFNDIGDILLETNTNEEKFKPIDKLKTLKDGKFNVLVKELEC